MPSLKSFLLFATMATALVVEPVQRLDKRDTSLKLEDHQGSAKLAVRACPISPPNCLVTVSDFNSCSGGTVNWVTLGGCGGGKSFPPNATQGIEGCDEGYSMEWKLEGDESHIIVREPEGSSKTFNIGCEDGTFPPTCPGQVCHADLK